MFDSASDSFLNVRRRSDRGGMKMEEVTADGRMEKRGREEREEREKKRLDGWKREERWRDEGEERRKEGSQGGHER